MKTVPVCLIEDLPEGCARVFVLEGRELVLVRDGMQVYALRNLCPHQGARLSEGLLSCRRFPGSVGEYRTDGQDCILRCPWHNWEFDIETGASTHDPRRVRVSKYPATIVNGEVFVSL